MPASSASDLAANQADVEFAQMMIVHHQGAIDMARLAPERAQAEEVLDLAAAIEQAQQPEIDTMTGWLEAWGAPPAAPDGAMAGMDHGSMSESGEGGMADDESMARLEAAQGAEFDTLFLELMIVHHEGAIAMAQLEIEDGQHPEAVDLAHRVVTDQSAEITVMRSLLEEA